MLETEGNEGDWVKKEIIIKDRKVIFSRICSFGDWHCYSRLGVLPRGSITTFKVTFYDEFGYFTIMHKEIKIDNSILKKILVDKDEKYLCYGIKPNKNTRF